MKAVSRYEKIGFKQPIKKAWLDCAVILLLQGKTSQEIRNALTELISKDDTASGHRSDGSVKYALAILGAWFAPEDDLKIFRNQLLVQAETLEQPQWISLHWAILVSAYPFLLTVATVIGRLFSLQDNASKTQILLRLTEIYGERETIERNMRYAIQSLIDMHLLDKTSEKAVYAISEKVPVLKMETALLLWKAILHASKAHRLPVASLRNAHSLYAFELPEITLGHAHEQFPDLDYMRFNHNDEFLVIL